MTLSGEQIQYVEVGEIKRNQKDTEQEEAKEEKSRIVRNPGDQVKKVF